ncbi:hypothetical protein APU20_07950, partial [Klebsiella variicola]
CVYVVGAGRAVVTTAGMTDWTREGGEGAFDRGGREGGEKDRVVGRMRWRGDLATGLAERAKV